MRRNMWANRVASAAIVALSIGLQGCATSASDPQYTHQPVQPERIFGLPKLSQNAAVARVVVMRDSQFVGSAMTTTLTLNGEEVAAINNGEKFEFYVEPGEHLLGLKFLGNDPVLGALTLGVARPKRFIEAATIFEAEKIYYFRIVDNANWEWDLKRSSR